MPYTFNGIGTWYYGKRNRSRVTMACEHCKRLGVLESYETREFIVVFFIPLIPLRKFQIINACPSCRKHRRMSLQDWQARSASVLQRVRDEAAAKPGDNDLQERIGWAQLELNQAQEAKETFAQLADATPRRATAAYGLARSLAALGQQGEAVEAYRRAIERKPDLAEAVRDCADLLLILHKQDDALSLLQEGHLHSPKDTGIVARIADVATTLKDWNAAANAYDRLFLALPQLRDNPKLAKASKKAHEKAGIPEAMP
jgi:tetratricopeptide (TPR) repeat protein